MDTQQLTEAGNQKLEEVVQSTTEVKELVFAEENEDERTSEFSQVTESEIAAVRCDDSELNEVNDATLGKFGDDIPDTTEAPSSEEQPSVEIPTKLPLSETQLSPSSSDSESSAESLPIHRPDDLKLPWAPGDKWWLKSTGLSRSLPTGYGSSTEALLDVASSTPLSAQGTVIKEGELISFYADEINNLIKLNSPRGSDSPGTPMSSTASASGWSSSGYAYSKVSRSPSERTQSPDDAPPIDPFVLNDLEQHALKVAASVDKMMTAIHTDLHKMSNLTCRHVDVYRDSVDSTCDAIDGTIKGMYALMAKCEETSRHLQPVYQLHSQVKEINQLLDTLEAVVNRGDVGGHHLHHQSSTASASSH